MADIFYAPRPQGKQRQHMLEAVMSRHSCTFETRGKALHYLSSIYMPFSRRWAFCRNGKAGTSSTIRFLFELEFGTPLTVNLKLPSDINPDVATHHLGFADVFRPLAGMPEGLDSLQDTLRLTTVRHPATRAISAFFYLCLSNDEAHPWFATDRLRMNALVAFDWQRDPRSATGLEKFLRYIELTIQAAGSDAVDAHWRPQIANIKPEIFQPHFVGRTENLGHFFREIADRFETPLPTDWQVPVDNKGPQQSAAEALLTPESRKLINRIYSLDFETFDYAPDISAGSHPLAPSFGQVT